ncbi:hypothetical protein QM467_00610 [Rhodoblastus sp. 17X3]|uniref:hypothetical protein n=1 Tax=Rhodoblastus sp. 17X3 TaxID=3047026 RepID=UPI0024B769CE|nr:hypothetical protein [Rhodoblastus sp. 17X3]MDI9846552.1 hypothetical protein [Rhodoblastus sp. 17X3]
MTPELKQAVELIRGVIAPFADRYLYETCLDLAGRPQAEIDAELARIGSEVSRLIKELNPEISDAVAFAMPKVFIDMAREQLLTMPAAGQA